MKNKVLAVLSMSVGLLMVSGSMFAHHSVAVHDLTRIVTLEATVTKFEFINPHNLLHFDVKDAEGNVEKWVANAGHLAQMKKLGWNRDIFKPGDQITISGNPYKDGRRILLALKIVRANGEDIPLEATKRLDLYLDKAGKK